jgi:peptidylprolyl isomerase
VVRPAALLVLAAALAGPASAEPATAGWRPLDPDNTLLIDTTKGQVVLEMRPEIAPLAVARIRTLARRGYYDGALFYRVVKGYMAQTGDKGARTFRSDLPNLKAEFTFQRTDRTPFTAVGDIPGGEVGFIGSTPVRIDKPVGGGPEVGWAQYCPGVAAMPHYANPDSANSQFFLMSGPAPQLDKTFTVWGRVISGLQAIKALNEGEPPTHPDRMTRVRVLADVPAAERPKLEVMDAASPAFAELFRKAMQDKGAGFTLCDVDLPVRALP